MRIAKVVASALSMSLVGMAGCGMATDQTVGDGDRTKSDGKADASAEAVFVDLEFDGEVVTSTSFDPERQIEDQLLYTVGQLNGDRSVGRLDRVELTDIQSETRDGTTVLSYHARLPVAWGNKDSVPSSYTLRIPRDISFQGQQAFTDAYKRDCVDFGAHDLSPGNMWYYYRPDSWGCELAAEDIVEIDASVSLSSINTTGKFPEYHKVWEDDALRVVAVFGKYEDGATTDSDAGIRGYNRFISALSRELSPFGVATTPAELPPSPGVDVPDITFETELADGRRVVVSALLVDNVRTAGAEFDARYAELSPAADVIVYNGHAGLGSNIRALARKGTWQTGQYSIVFMNGCDTYAYVDSALHDAHAEVNPDDPSGTKYVDIVTNALPSFFRSMPGATIPFITALMDTEEPQTYEQIFADIDPAQVVLVSGEQDNEFVPGFPGGGDPVDDWAGLHETGTVAANEEHRFSTPTLPAGKYFFSLMGDAGDADLYVRTGDEPSVTSYDCRPYKAGSSEICQVELGSAAKVHVMVRGWASSSDYELFGEIDRPIHPL